MLVQIEYAIPITQSQMQSA